MNKKNYELSEKILRLANRGARRARVLAHKAGIANPYSMNGKVVYELPDGTITEKYKYPKSIKISKK